MTKKEMIITAIEELGYKPQVDSDGDIFVRYQMKNIYIVVGEDEEPYAVAILPQFTEVNEGEEPITLAVCNKVTRDVKLAKVYIDRTFKSVSASCEFFYTDEACLKASIGHALSILGMIRSTYHNAKAALSE